MQFSIIIPTLNEEKFVGGILDDLAKQDFRDFEVVHVDGKSEDRTCDVVHSYSTKLHITPISCPKRNVSHQKNLGAEKAEGKYLVFVDADTRISDPHFLTTIAEETRKSMYLIYMPIVRIADQDRVLQATFFVFNKAVEASRYSPGPIPSMGLMIFERAFFHHLHGYASSRRQDGNKLFSEDYEILMRAKKMGVSGCVIHDAHFLYSLRRFKQEGLLKIVPKYILSGVEQLLGREFIETSYEMGGHLYDEKLL
ncbi:glycosyltransferase [Candidatus Woesebacteria bacterium]|nr:glycosyltransferase [Candidatus Woesebacteria bacterium]